MKWKPTFRIRTTQTRGWSRFEPNKKKGAMEIPLPLCCFEKTQLLQTFVWETKTRLRNRVLMIERSLISQNFARRAEQLCSYDLGGKHVSTYRETGKNSIVLFWIGSRLFESERLKREDCVVLKWTKTISEIEFWWYRDRLYLKISLVAWSIFVGMIWAVNMHAYLLRNYLRNEKPSQKSSFDDREGASISKFRSSCGATV